MYIVWILYSIYRQILNIGRTLVGNKLLQNRDPLHNFDILDTFPEIYNSSVAICISSSIVSNI